jgi:hypothetical protein
MRLGVSAFAAGAMLVGCSTSISTSTPAKTDCNPLATHPTTLATILGVGKKRSRARTA